MHPIHGIVKDALEIDLTQMLEAGHDETTLRSELDEAAAMDSTDALLKLQEDWWSRPSPDGFPYDEPSDWETISSHFPDAESHARFTGTDDELADRILAGWQGRCAGCQLGKPLEGPSKPAVIERILKTVGSWPLADYMNPPPPGLEIEKLPDCDFFEKSWKTNNCKGRFHAVAPDDDIHYALIGQRVLAAKGVEFTSDDVMREVIARTPGNSIFASGRNMYRTGLMGMTPPHTALFGNPCRQSLGAQIRCDPWGWGAPANPALAARMAYKDAYATQTRNGIYSGIFFAVAMADALAHGDAARALETASAYVPPKTRFAEMLAFVKEQCAAHADWAAVNAAIHREYEREAARFNHSLPNAAIVVMGILKGGGEFTRTIGVTVMAGLDTDCTGATAGSIMGCALGTAGIPSHWTAPFNDTIHTNLCDMRELKISDVGRQMYEIAKGNARHDSR